MLDKQHHQLASNQPPRRHMSPRTSRRIAGIAIAAVTATGAVSAYNHNNSPESAASFVADSLRTTGKVDYGMTVTFGPRTEYRRTPAIVSATEDQPSNVMGSISDDEELIDKNPIVITGNDNREYVVTLAPGSHATTPTSIEDLSHNAAVFPLNDGDISYASGAANQLPEFLINGKIPTDAGRVQKGFKE